MKYKFSQALEALNLDKINLIVFIFGFVLVVIGILIPSITTDIETGTVQPNNIPTILLSVGTSMVASSIIAFISSRYLIKKNKIKDIMERWGFEGIYQTRAEMNESANRCLDKIDKNWDIIALGMRGYRDAKADVIENKVKKGIKIRILTLKPESTFVEQREKDEDKVPGEIKRTIYGLIDWIPKLKSLSPDVNNVQIRFYDTYPLDSYLRIDNHIFIGPNMYKRLSQQTISYEFRGNSLGFLYYSKYFDDLWNDEKFCTDNYK